MYLFRDYMVAYLLLHPLVSATFFSIASTKLYETNSCIEISNYHWMTEHGSVIIVIDFSILINNFVLRRVTPFVIKVSSVTKRSIVIKIVIKLEISFCVNIVNYISTNFVSNGFKTIDGKLNS